MDQQKLIDDSANVGDDDSLVTPIVGARVNNFPPCKPMFHHRLAEIPKDSRQMVKLALSGVLLVTLAYVWNCLALSANFITSGQHVFEFALSIGYVFAGPMAASTVYMCLYTAARKRSSMYYCCFFTFFTTGTAFFAILAIAPPSWGSAGIITMTSTTGTHNVVADAMEGICIALWILVVLYNIYLFFIVRKAYRDVGGTRAAAREAGRAGAKAAYDHREEIKEVAAENKDFIVQVAKDNQDLIVDVAKDNQDLLIDVMQENKGAVAQAAIENPDLVMSIASAASSDSKSTTKDSDALKIKWDDYD